MSQRWMSFPARAVTCGKVTYVIVRNLRSCVLPRVWVRFSIEILVESRNVDWMFISSVRA